MRFAESKRRMPWIKIVLALIVIVGGFLSFCEFNPATKTVQKTIVFEAD